MPSVIHQMQHNVVNYIVQKSFVCTVYGTLLLSMQGSEGREDDLWCQGAVSKIYGTIVYNPCSPSHSSSHHQKTEKHSVTQFCQNTSHPPASETYLAADSFVAFVTSHFVAFVTPLALTHLLSHILPGIDVSSGSSVSL